MYRVFDQFCCEIFAAIYNVYKRYKDLLANLPKKINNKLEDLYEQSNFNN